MTRFLLLIFAFLGLGTPAVAAGNGARLPDCPTEMSPRLCLTLLARSVAEDTYQQSKSEILAEITRMQRADNRDDLARDTLKLAVSAALTTEPQGKRASQLGRLAALRIALEDSQTVKADAASFSDPQARANYQMSVLSAALVNGDGQTAEQLIADIRQIASTARPPNRSAIHQRLLRTLAATGRRELADTLANDISDQHLTSWFQTAELSEAIDDKLKHNLDREAEALIQKEAPLSQFYWKKIAEAKIGKKDYASAVATIERHLTSPEKEELLIRVHIARRAFSEAIKLVTRMPQDNWVLLNDIWFDITIAQAKAQLVDAAIASSAHVQHDTSRVKAAIIAALMRAGRKREAVALAKSAVDLNDMSYTGHWMGEGGAADALLAVGDFRMAASIVGKHCLLSVTAGMLDSKRQQGRLKEAVALLDASDSIVQSCLPSIQGESIEDVGRYLCHYASLKPLKASLAKAAEIDKILKDSNVRDYWNESERTRVYDCIATAAAKSGNWASARRVALNAPTPNAARVALTNLTELEALHNPSDAANLYRTLLSREDIGPGNRGFAIMGLMHVLRCQFGRSCKKDAIAD